MTNNTDFQNDLQRLANTFQTPTTESFYEYIVCIIRNFLKFC